MAKPVADPLRQALCLARAIQPEPSHRGGDRIRPPRIEWKPGLDLWQDGLRIDASDSGTPGADQKVKKIGREGMPGPRGLGFGEVAQGIESVPNGVVESSLDIDVSSGDLDVRIGHGGPGRSTLRIFGSSDLVKLPRHLSGTASVVEQSGLRKNECAARKVMRSFGDGYPIQKASGRSEDLGSG